MIGRDASIDRALRQFADAVTTKRARLPAGAPEDQLRGPFENLLSGVAAALGWNIVCTGETPLPDRLGCPDYAVHNDGLLAGYVELEAPGTGADARRFKGRDLRQFRRFSAVPNLLYGDGGEWALYRGGERIGNVVRLSGDIARDGGKAVAPGDARAGDGAISVRRAWPIGTAWRARRRPRRRHRRRSSPGAWRLASDGRHRVFAPLRYAPRREDAMPGRLLV